MPRYVVTMTRVIHQSAQVTFSAEDADGAKRIAGWLDRRGQAPWREVSTTAPDYVVNPLPPDDAA